MFMLVRFYLVHITNLRVLEVSGSSTQRRSDAWNTIRKNLLTQKHTFLYKSWWNLQLQTHLYLSLSFGVASLLLVTLYNPSIYEQNPPKQTNCWAAVNVRKTFTWSWINKWTTTNAVIDMYRYHDFMYVKYKNLISDIICKLEIFESWASMENIIFPFWWW